jgi:hypothetical protein
MAAKAKVVGIALGCVLSWAACSGGSEKRGLGHGAGGARQGDAGEVIVTPPDSGPAACGNQKALFNVVLGRPTATSVAANVLVEPGAQAFIEVGTECGSFSLQSPTVTSVSGEPLVIELTGLAPDTLYNYRLHVRRAGEVSDTVDSEQTFHTARAPGSGFAFAVRGDSHPERSGSMFNAELYKLHMRSVLARQPEFSIWLGDDFSIDPLIDKNALSAAAVDSVYLNQRTFAGLLAGTVPIFLVNGNHEEEAGYLLSSTYVTPYANGPVWAGVARTKYFAEPAPDGFYSGDNQVIPGMGPLRDYYAWTWGDALFVVIDPYWHSPVPVDNPVPGVSGGKASWDATMGDEQYNWFRTTLEQSQAKYKFVFAHHVNGTGRGGAALAHLYEWGGYDQKGKNYVFASKRPTWPKPIHQLMRDTRVTIFFFGHDHLFAREQVDGVVYQSVPNPADNSYTAFNSDAFAPTSIALPGAAYDPGYGVVLPNSGHLHVSVTVAQVTVEYVRAVLPGDEQAAGAANDEVSFSYAVAAH